jgi:RHS repeat-associated protein
LGRAVEQTVGSNKTDIVYSPTGVKLALMNATSTPSLAKAFVPLPAGDTAVYTSSTSPAYFRHTDHLGSSRFASTMSQTLYADYAYSPFGQPYAQSGAIDPSFTGQNQDALSGVYDFPYREHDPYQARWTQPDPAGLAAANPANPQSWNRYAYALNNPLAFIDPLGLTPQCNTAQNRAPEMERDSKTGGPFNGDSDYGGFADPGNPQNQGCGSIPPWYYTVLGGGNDPFFGDGEDTIYDQPLGGGSATGFDPYSLGFTTDDGGGGLGPFTMVGVGLTDPSCDWGLPTPICPQINLTVWERYPTSGRSSGNPSPTWAAITAFFTLPSIGQGSCLGTAIGAFRQPFSATMSMASNIKSATPFVLGAANATSSLAVDISALQRAKALAPGLGPIAVTVTGLAGVAAQNLASLTAAVASKVPLAAAIGTELIGAYAVAKEGYVAWTGGCHP